MKKIKDVERKFKMTFSVNGTCPHCDKEIDISKVEEPLNQDVLDMWGSDVVEWKDMIKERLPIISDIKSETFYIFKGECPYCNKEIETLQDFRMAHYEPPKFCEGEEKTIHTLTHCPFCKEVIHIHSGYFYMRSECCGTKTENGSALGGKVFKISELGRKKGRPSGEDILNDEEKGNPCKNCGHKVFFGKHYIKGNIISDICPQCGCKEPEI